MNLPDAASASDRAAAAEQDRWFAEQVYRHDTSLRAYLNGCFPAVRDEVDDVVQESYLRLWKARAGRPIKSARAFLFRVARNIAVDFVRHHQASPVEPVRHLEGLPVLEDGLDAAEAAGRRERIRLLADAVADLPARCREIFIRHKIQGYSRKEVAAQLGLSDRTIGVQTERAMRRCAEYLRRRGVSGLYEDDAR